MPWARLGMTRIWIAYGHDPSSTCVMCERTTDVNMHGAVGERQIFISTALAKAPRAPASARGRSVVVDDLRQNDSIRAPPAASGMGFHTDLRVGARHQRSSSVSQYDLLRSRSLIVLGCATKRRQRRPYPQANPLTHVPIGCDIQAACYKPRSFNRLES